MLIYKIFILLFSLKTATCSCNYEVKKAAFAKKHQKISKTGRLPVCISESSGLVKAWQDGYYWTHNDSGGNPELYMIDSRGYVFDTIFIENGQNFDWEDVSKDTKGNIYVGDFGNNLNQRKDLAIYKRKYEGIEKINFRYEDQTFDLAEKKIFDCEAFFWANDSLYLFTKSYESGLKQTSLYVLPDTEGTHVAKKIDNLTLKAQITGAAISPSKNQFSLISYGKILNFKIENNKINFQRPLNCIKIGRGQTEAIAYENEETLVFTNENRKIFKLTLPKP
jgi:hypothetical protein